MFSVSADVPGNEFTERCDAEGFGENRGGPVFSCSLAQLMGREGTHEDDWNLGMVRPHVRQHF